MDDNAFVAALDNLLPRLRVTYRAGGLFSYVVRVIFFKVIVNRTAAPLRDGIHVLPLSAKEERNIRSDSLIYINTL